MSRLFEARVGEQITRLCMARYARGIMRVSANGGTPELLVKSEAGLSCHPQILPDGKSVLFTLLASSATQSGYGAVAQIGEAKGIIRRRSTARYLPTGHLVYGLPNNNNLFAIPFDLDRLEVIGGPVPVVEGFEGDGRTMPFPTRGRWFIYREQQCSRASSEDPRLGRPEWEGGAACSPTQYLR